MGERFGGYELHEKLGEGGMAEVFRASRRGEGGFVRTVCIKRLLRHIEADAAMAASFGDEARIMAALHHPAIVSVLEYGQHQSRTFLAMELVEGVDLRKMIRRTGPLPFELVIYIGHEIATALAHAHAVKIDGIEQRVVHRDVTPSNVLISVDGTVKLTDFGIAKATTRAQVTQHGIVKGKVPYMSPEQAIGQELDQRADLFALGVVLFECIAGRRPYDGASDLETFRNVQSGVHASLDRLVPSTPRPLVELISALLRPRREDRIPSAADVVDLLGRFPVTLATRRALRDRVARCDAPNRRPPVSARSTPVPLDGEPAALIEPASTRAVKAQRAPKRSITEAMSPTAIGRCLADERAVREPEIAIEIEVMPARGASYGELSAAPVSQRGEATERNVRREKSAPSVTLSRGAIVAMAIAWITLSSILGGLAAQLLPSAGIARALPATISSP